MNDNTTCRAPEPAVAWVGRHLGPWFALLWVPVLLAAPLVAAVAGGRWPQAVQVLAIGAVYTVTVSQPRGRRAEAMLLALSLLVTAYLVLWRTDRQFVFPLLAIAVAVAARTRWAPSLIASLTISGAVAVGVESRSIDVALSLGFATFFAGVGTFLMYYLAGTVAELRRTRELLARAAVDEERLRFSRDLHDLLGHTLSVMVVAAQAVRRLIGRDPEAAVQHARNIETTGRRALAEVRQAATGYHSVHLRDELANAQAALRAADVRVDADPPAVDLYAEIDSLFGWVVREGTTNVLRHAQARTCRIIVTAGRETATVEVIDDGRGGSTGNGPGLPGLRERVADLGGELTAAPTEAGFRLVAAVPRTSPGGRQP